MSVETHRSERGRVAEFLEATFDSIDQGITIYDADYRLVAWNRRYTELDPGLTDGLLRYGVSLFEIYRVAASNGVLGEGDPDEVARRHTDAIRQGPLIQSQILESPDGKRVRIRRFRLPDGGICATFRDITEELRVEAELRQASKMDAIGKLTGGIAHDLNNILAVIIGNLEMSIASIRSDEERLGLDDALEAANRGAQLTHRLLAYARQQPLAPEVLRLAPLLASLSSLLQRLLGETIELQVVAGRGLWFCKVDKVQLESSIINLAVNARDAMPNGGKLTLEVSNARVDDHDAASLLGIDTGSYVLVTVTDNGMGMAEDVLDKIFDPFFTTKRVGEGTGLGLSMVHGFVRQSGGFVRAHSELGEGTTMKMYLPRHSGPGEQVESSPDARLSHGNGQQRVLVVEDDSRLRDLILRQLHTLGYATIDAANGEAAFQCVMDCREVDLLLTDVVLPGGLSGQEVAEGVKEMIPGIPVVYMSGYNDNVLGDHSKLDDGVTLLHKPFRLADLSRALRSKLETDE